MPSLMLSESAVAMLRFRIKGYRVKLREQDRPAAEELVAAGIMEPDGRGDYRLTGAGAADWRELLAEQEDRIERERYAPPDDGLMLSDEARELLRRRANREEATVTPENLPAYRELAAARIMFPVSGFSTGPEAVFRFTYWGWKRREEFAAPAPRP